MGKENPSLIFPAVTLPPSQLSAVEGARYSQNTKTFEKNKSPSALDMARQKKETLERIQVKLMRGRNKWQGKEQLFKEILAQMKHTPDCLTETCTHIMQTKDLSTDLDNDIILPLPAGNIHGQTDNRLSETKCNKHLNNVKQETRLSLFNNSLVKNEVRDHSAHDVCFETDFTYDADDACLNYLHLLSTSPDASRDHDCSDTSDDYNKMTLSESSENCFDSRLFSLCQQRQYGDLPFSEQDETNNDFKEEDNYILSEDLVSFTRPHSEMSFENVLQYEECGQSLQKGNNRGNKQAIKRTYSSSETQGHRIRFVKQKQVCIIKEKPKANTASKQSVPADEKNSVESKNNTKVDPATDKASVCELVDIETGQEKVAKLDKEKGENNNGTKKAQTSVGKTENERHSNDSDVETNLGMLENRKEGTYSAEITTVDPGKADGCKDEKATAATAQDESYKQEISADDGKVDSVDEKITTSCAIKLDGLKEIIPNVGTAEVDSTRKNLTIDNAVQVDSSKQEITTAETANVDSSKQDITSAATAKVDSSKQDITNAATAKVDSSKQDITNAARAKVDSSKQDITNAARAKVDSSKQEITAERAKVDSSKQEKTTLETVEVDSSRQHILAEVGQVDNVNDEITTSGTAEVGGPTVNMTAVGITEVDDTEENKTTDNIAKVDSSKQEITTAETAKVDSSKQVITTAETAKVGSSKQEITTAETAKVDSSKQEITTAEIDKVDSSKQEITTVETAKVDSSKQEIITADTANNVSSRQEIIRTETAKVDSSKQEITTAEIDKVDSFKQEITASEAAKVANFKQEITTVETADVDSFEEEIIAADAAKVDVSSKGITTADTAKVDVSSNEITTTDTAKVNVSLKGITTADTAKVNVSLKEITTADTAKVNVSLKGITTADTAKVDVSSKGVASAYTAKADIYTERMRTTGTPKVHRSNNTALNGTHVQQSEGLRSDKAVSCDLFSVALEKDNPKLEDEATAVSINKTYQAIAENNEEKEANTENVTNIAEE